MKIYPLGAIAWVLLAAALGLCGYHYFYHPAFDFRLVASVSVILSYFLFFKEFRKHGSATLVAGMILSMMALGASLDRDPATHIPFMTLSMFFSCLLTKKFFRRWFSETTLLWADPLFVIASFSSYFAGNLYYEMGWKGWVLPLPPLALNAFMGLMDYKFGRLTVRYVRDKKLIYEAGKTAPDFCLPDYEGKEVRLSDFAGKRDVLLMFVRNAWCPSCHIMLRTYQRNSAKFREKNILMFAIGPDISEVNKQMALDLGIDFKILSDHEMRTAMAYSVHLPSELIGNKEGLPLPASFLVDKKGIIRYTSRPDRVGEFFAPETIFPILDSLN